MNRKTGKTNNLIVDEINDSIDMFQKEPWIYDNNVYRCYGACKRIIREMQKRRIIDGTCETYICYIEHITKRLNI